MTAIALLYHDVVGDQESMAASGFCGPGTARYKLRESQFSAHLEALKAANQAPIAAMQLRQMKNSPGRQLLLTFDDGGSSAYHRIAPALAKLGWKAHFFVTVGHIERAAFLTREQIRSLRELGHTIGSHSYSHPARMSAGSEQHILQEWQRSIGMLSEILGEPVTTASVPGGHYSIKVARAAALAGVHVLFTSEPVISVTEVEGCAIVGRFSIVRSTPPATVAALASGKKMPRLTQAIFWNTRKLAKKIGGELYLNARNAILKKN